VRRADRLFQIVQHLRRKRRGATTAKSLAEALEVSERTIYRDVQDLLASGVPIQGEAGVGYALPASFDLPPLMFNEDEIEALVLGARVVKSWTDPELARAAESVLAKVEAVLPDRLRARLAESALFALNFRRAVTPEFTMLRAAIREKRKISFGYTDRKEASTERSAQPLGLFYWGVTWSLGAWCELRQDFRNFRVDRMKQIALTDETFASEAGRTLEDFLRHYREERTSE
jgi:predicted DNA-binding transcriptional regulator YafY